MKNNNNNLKKWSIIIGGIISLIVTLVSFGMRCIYTEIDGKLDKEFYNNDKMISEKFRDGVDDRLRAIERELIRQGKVQYMIAEKLKVRVNEE